jgi:hypothetical protein
MVRWYFKYSNERWHRLTDKYLNFQFKMISSISQIDDVKSFKYIILKLFLYTISCLYLITFWFSWVCLDIQSINPAASQCWNNQSISGSGWIIIATGASIPTLLKIKWKHQNCLPCNLIQLTCSYKNTWF